MGISEALNTIDTTNDQQRAAAAQAVEADRTAYREMIGRFAAGQEKEQDTPQALEDLLDKLGLTTRDAASDAAVVKRSIDRTAETDALQAQLDNLGSMESLQSELTDADAAIQAAAGPAIAAKQTVVTKIDDHNDLTETLRSIKRTAGPLSRDSDQLARLGFDAEPE